MDDQPDLTPPTAPYADFETRTAYGIAVVLSERPELREVMRPAALIDESLRWCA